MAYLLDSDIVIRFLAGDRSAMGRVDALAADGISISTVTYMEVLQGILADDSAVDARALFEAFLTDVPILPFSVEIADRCARLRLELKRDGKRIRPRALDLIVAATALHHRLALVTRNVADYRDFPALEVF